MPSHSPQYSVNLSSELQARLLSKGIKEHDEITLRQQLEAHAETYTLIKLAPWPARRWKCHYRIMMGSGMYDAQTVAEAYALALLAVIENPVSPTSETKR